MGTTDVTEPTDSFKFIYNAGNKTLLCICAAMVCLAVNLRKSDMEQALQDRTNCKFTLSDRIFSLDPGLASLIDPDGKQFMGITAQIFVSSRGDCVEVCNGKLQYPDGGNIENLQVLEGQEFRPVISKPSFPRNIFKSTNKQSYVSNESKFWSNEKKSQPQSLQDQLSADSTFKPMP